MSAAERATATAGLTVAQEGAGTAHKPTTADALTIAGTPELRKPAAEGTLPAALGDSKSRNLAIQRIQGRQ